MRPDETPTSSTTPPDRRTNSHPRARETRSWLHRRLCTAWVAVRRWFQANTDAPRWLAAGRSHPSVSYLLALLVEIAAASLTLLLLQPLPLFALQGSLLLLGIVVVALTWGAGPSLVATLVGTALLELLVVPPYASRFLHGMADSRAGVLFLLVGCSISLIASQSGRARRQAEALARQLGTEKARSDLEHQRLRTLLEVLPAAVGMVDAQGRFVELTPAVKAVWGTEFFPGELAHLQAHQGWYPNTGQPLSVEDWAIARALTRGETILNEEVEELVEGQRKVILHSAAPIRDATGAIHGAAGVLQDITDRKRMEQEQALRAAQLEAILESIADGLIVTDAQGRLLHLNRAYRTLLGLEDEPKGVTLPTLQQLAGHAVLTAAGHPVTEAERPVNRILQGEVLTGTKHVDLLLHTRAGREVQVNVSGAPIRDTAGHLLGAVQVLRDVTEQRRLEREVTEHAAQLEAIFESIADKIFVTDRAGRVLHMNQAYRTLLELEQDPTGWTFPQLEALAGFAGSTPAGQPLLEVEDPITRVLWGEVLTKEQSVDIILRMRTGREVWLNLVGTPIRDATGQVLGSVLVGRDVSEQRRLEQQTRETLDALLAMAEALVQGHEAAEQGMQARDQVLRPGADPALARVAARLAELTCRVLDCRSVSIAAVDAATEALTPITVVGLSPADEQRWWARWEGQPRLGEVLPPSAVATLQAGEPVLLERLPAPFLWWQQLAPVCPSVLLPMHVGETLVGVLQVNGGAPEEAYTSKNRQALLRAVARLGALVLERERLLCDRTEARANELALRETQAQMETFLGMAGHELKNPLTSLKLTLQLVERHLRRSARQETDAAHDLTPFLDQVARAEHQSTRLERLVNELLDASRVRAGKLELHPEPADLAAIVGEAVDEQRQANPARTLIFQVLPERPVSVSADADRIGQVVTNYLTNALKYSPADRPVTVGLDLDEGQARVWVRDQGPGLPAEEQERIWERFHRAKGIEVQSGSGVGLGLGLHICRTIMEQHQGQVGVESAPGQGSTFWFTLPLAPVKEG